MKKFIVTLALVLFVLGNLVSAWAVGPGQGSPCTIYTGSSNSSCLSPRAGSEGTSGSWNKMFFTLNPYNCTKGTAQNSQGGGVKGSADTRAGCTYQGDLFGYFNCPSQQGKTCVNGDCPFGKATTAPTATPKAAQTTAPTAAPATTPKAGPKAAQVVTPTAAPRATPAAAPTAVPKAAQAKENSDTSATDKTEAKPDTVVKPVEAAAPEAKTPATCNDNGCKVGDDCGQSNCSKTGNNCGAESCKTKLSCAAADAAAPASGRSLYDVIAEVLEKCGIDASQISFLKNICPSAPVVTAPSETPSTKPPVNETPSPETPQPTPAGGGAETTPPPDDDNKPTPDNSADNLYFEHQVVALVNEQRAANGLAPLKLNENLSNVARTKSQDMHDNNYFSHTSPTYGSPFDMMKSFGISYRTAGENIAKGYGTPEAVMQGWMNSPGHRANILNGSFTQIGVGYVADGNYWTQMFIG